MIVLIGKSGSGKSTIADILCNKFGFNKVVTTTTRPKRKGEKQNIDYHFVTDKQFDEMNADGKFIEVRNYKVASGEEWKYGSPLEEIESAGEKDIIILTPEGCKNVINKIGKENVIVIYIYTNIRTIQYRLKRRGDDMDEIDRRMEQDKEDFKDATELADFMVYNHYGDDLSVTISILINYLKKRGVNVEVS